MTGYEGRCDCGREGHIRHLPNAPVSLMICESCYFKYRLRSLCCPVLLFLTVTGLVLFFNRHLLF